jgi:hypothetical protein
MAGRGEVDRLLEVITLDCYNASEQMTAFDEVSGEEVPLPTTATVVGTAVRLVGIDMAEDGQELTARCQRAEVVQDLRLSDLVFLGDAPAAWIHAAYRRCLGLRAHPTAMPAGCKPSWL